MTERTDLYADHPDDHRQNGAYLGYHTPADPADVKAVLDRAPVGHDSRSDFKWIRLANGDLILGVYPQGDTYLEFGDKAP